MQIDMNAPTMPLIFSEMRKRAFDVFMAGVGEANPVNAVEEALKGRRFTRPTIIAVGKAGRTMAQAAMRQVKAETVVVVTNYENAEPLEGAEVRAAAHPVPDVEGARASQRVEGALSMAQGDVIALISGLQDFTHVETLALARQVFEEVVEENDPQVDTAYTLTSLASFANAHTAMVGRYSPDRAYRYRGRRADPASGRGGDDTPARRQCDRAIARRAGLRPASGRQTRSRRAGRADRQYLDHRRPSGQCGDRDLQRLEGGGGAVLEGNGQGARHRGDYD